MTDPTPAKKAPAKKVAAAKKAAGPRADPQPKVADREPTAIEAAAIAESDQPTELVPVHVAWSRVMGDVRAIAKDSRNTFHNFDFRGIDAVMDAVGPVFRTHGVFCIPVGIDSTHRDFDSRGGGTQHEAIVTVDYDIYGPRGDRMRAQSIGEASDSSDKATTQAMSVAYRTLLLQGLTIPTGDKDPDESTAERAGSQRTQANGQAASGGPLDWPSRDAQGHAWEELAARGKALPPAIKEQVLAPWVAEVGLAIEKMDRAMANQWAGKLDEAEALAKQPPADASQAATNVTDSFGGAEEATGEIAGSGPDLAPAHAYSELNAAQGKLSAAGIDAVQKWRDKLDLTPETLTREQANEWHAQIANFAPDPHDQQAQEPANEWWTDLGWRSLKELQDTHRSLLERHTALPSHDQPGVSQGLELAPNKMTKATSGTWLGRIATAEQLEEPF